MRQLDRSAMIRATYDTVTDGYDKRTCRFWQENAKEICNLLDLKGRERVLDVATGTGNLALELACRVPNGQVAGIDFSKGMLGRARKKAKDRDLHNVSFAEMDMRSIDFPDDSFDAAACSLGIFFAENIVELLKHITGKARPGGKILFSTYREDAYSPLAEMFHSRIQNYGVEVPPPRWKTIGTEKKCAALCQSSGLTDVRIIEKDFGYYLRDAEEWWNVIWWGGSRRFVEPLSPSDLDRFKTEHLEDVRTIRTQAGIWLNLKVLYAVGTRP